MKLKLFVVLIIVSSTFKTVGAFIGPYVPEVEVLPAKDARDIIMDKIHSEHKKAIDWWVDFINKKVMAESENGNACVLINITVASSEVQDYLEFAYDRAGYYQTELVPGWIYEDTHHHGGHPDGKTYLSLSW